MSKYKTAIQIIPLKLKVGFGELPVPLKYTEGLNDKIQWMLPMPT